METRTSQLLGRLSESATIAMSRKARELGRRQGHHQPLLGEPDFDTPNAIKAAGIQAIEDNFTHYPPVPGYGEVRQAICDKLLRDNDCVRTGSNRGLHRRQAQLDERRPEPGRSGRRGHPPTPFGVSYADMSPGRGRVDGGDRH